MRRKVSPLVLPASFSRTCATASLTSAASSSIQPSAASLKPGVSFCTKRVAANIARTSAVNDWVKSNISPWMANGSPPKVCATALNPFATSSAGAASPTGASMAKLPRTCSAKPRSSSPISSLAIVNCCRTRRNRSGSTPGRCPAIEKILAKALHLGDGVFPVAVHLVAQFFERVLKEVGVRDQILVAHPLAFGVLARAFAFGARRFLPAPRLQKTFDKIWNDAGRALKMLRNSMRQGVEIVRRDRLRDGRAAARLRFGRRHFAIFHRCIPYRLPRVACGGGQAAHSRLSALRFEASRPARRPAYPVVSSTGPRGTAPARAAPKRFNQTATISRYLRLHYIVRI